MKRRVVAYLWLICLTGFLANVCFPIRTGLTRVSFVGLAFLIVTGTILISWPVRLLRFALIVLCIAVTTFLVFPSSDPPEQKELRNLYVQRLRQYDGTRYVYGGENRFGMDCSGLVREGMIESLFSYGVRRLNPGAVRAAFSLWWHDCSATKLINIPGVTGPVRGEDYVPLHDTTDVVAGDLAITKSGSHVLAYLGDQHWIEADPGVGGTHLFTLDGEFKYLSDELVVFVRWHWLEPPPHTPEG